MKHELKETSLVTRSASISWCDLGEEVVVLRVKDQAYYRLQDSARAIWLQLERPRSLGDLVAAMQGTHVGHPVDIAVETRAFVEQCTGLDLLHVGDGAS